MKKLVIIAVLSLGLVASCYSQAFFNFDNASRYDGTANPYLPYIGAQGVAGEGDIGAIIGSDPTHATPNYDIGYLWLNGIANVGKHWSPADFLAAGASLGSFTTSFDAPTGDLCDGAGLVGAGTTHVPGTTAGQTITLQLVAWYDPTGTTSFATALADGWNTGGSALMPIRLVIGDVGNMADLNNFQGFAVGAVPEPATFALAGMGGLGLLLFRRRRS